MQQQEGFGQPLLQSVKNVFYSQKAGVFAKNKHNFQFIWVFVIAGLATGCFIDIFFAKWYANEMEYLYQGPIKYIYDQTKANYPLYFKLLTACVTFDIILLIGCLIMLITHVILISKLNRLSYLIISFIFFTFITLRVMIGILYYLDPNENFVKDNYGGIAALSLQPTPFPPDQAAQLTLQVKTLTGWRRQYQWSWAAFGLISGFGFYSFFLLIAGYNELVYNWRKQQIEKNNQ